MNYRFLASKFCEDVLITKNIKSKGSKPVKNGNAEDAAFLMKISTSVIIVLGYGMAPSTMCKCTS